jgi:predicted TIM-barrel fold metal-dependent hydrolase
MRPPYQIFDAHVHIAPWEQVLPDAEALMKAGRKDFDAIYRICHDPHRLIAEMDRSGIEQLVMINYVTPEVVGFTEEANEFSARMADPYPHRLIPFGGIDPRRVSNVGEEMDHLLGDLGLRGIKLHPPHQFFRANDYRNGEALRGLATVYEKCIAHKVPVMVHTGTSVFPRARNKYADPMDLDDVIVDFPDLNIIIAHGGRPLYMDETFFLLRRSLNVFVDISSVPPKKLLDYFPWIDRVADQAMFGSDWPGPGVKDLSANIEDFYALSLPEDVKRKILRDTALKIFNQTTT